MNGYDYSKQIAKDRENFRDSMQRNREMTDKRIAEAEQRVSDVSKQQYDNFIKERNDVEKEYEVKLEKVNETNLEKLQDRTKKFNSELESERNRFANESVSKRTDFDRRLSDIRDSYKKVFDSEKERHNSVENYLTDKHDKNIKKFQEESETNVKNAQQSVQDFRQELKARKRRDIANLHEQHNRQLKDLTSDEVRKRGDLKEKLQNEIALTRSTTKAESDVVKEVAEQKIANARKHYQAINEKLEKHYSQKAEDLNRTTRQDRLAMNSKQSKELLEARRDYNKAIRDIEFQNKRKNSGSAELREVTEKQNNLRDKIILEKKNKDLRESITAMNADFNKRNISMQEKANETLREQNAEASIKLERTVNDLNADNLLKAAREEEKFALNLERRSEQTNIQKMEHENQLILQKDHSKERIKNLKENFNHSLHALEDQGKRNLESITKQTKEDKKEFMKKMEENRSKEIFSMRREFSKMMDATIGDYEQRLATFQRQNEVLKQNLDDKIESLMIESDQKLEQQARVYEEKRLADARDAQALMDEKDSKNRQAILELNGNFEKKMFDLQRDHEAKIKSLTNSYESKHLDLSINKNKEIKLSEERRLKEVNDLKNRFDSEKARLVGQYEEQIKSLKAVHNDQLNAVKEYNRIS